MTGATSVYREIFDSRSAEEVRQLAHIKRFMERLVADPKFRDKLRDNLDDLQGVADEYGIDVDPNQMLPLFHTQYLKHRYGPDEGKWPLSKAWSDYMKEMIAHRDLLRDKGGTPEVNPVFHAWRERQIARSMSELGGSAGSITHPIVAYELSSGCSVGCWFCGISAEKYQGSLAYTEESSALWRGVLQVMVDLFGSAAQTGFCYWATDPMDNPDYDKFIEDHQRVVGYLPQTTTAAPLKDVALTRRVLKLFDKYRCITNRFSILTLRLLDRVHAEFTPEELMGVELVTQNKEALTAKANAGRARERRHRLREAGKSDRIALLEADHATIACVSGFLINMPERTIRMVSPTRGGKRWPLGYRVYDSATFETPEDFRARIEEMLARHAARTVTGSDRLAFRPDLEFTATDEGFALESGGMRYTSAGYLFMRRLGELIAAGDKTAGEIHEILAGEGADIFMVAEVMQSFFTDGLLDDDPVHGGIRAPDTGLEEETAPQEEELRLSNV